MNNLMTTLGKQIDNISLDCNSYPSDLTELYVKSNLPISDEYFRKILFLKELLHFRSNEIKLKFPVLEVMNCLQIINFFSLNNLLYCYLYLRNKYIITIRTVKPS